MKSSRNLYQRTKETNVRSARPMKLYNGDWGAWVTGENVESNMLICISTGDGKSWHARVKKVLWKDRSGAICETKSPNAQTRKNSNKSLCLKCGRKRNDCECNSKKETNPIVVGLDGTTQAGSHSECKRCGMLLNDQENANGFCGNCLF